LTINDLLKNVKEVKGGLKKLKHWDKKHLMSEPLEKPIASQIKRKVNYNLTTKTLTKWDPIVESNRNASQLQFPLKQEILTLKPAQEVVKRFTPKTKLEKEVSELLNKSENNLTDNKVMDFFFNCILFDCIYCLIQALTVAEEKILKAMSLEEARLRHKELQKMRALLSYQEVKLKRQSKIKSKRYHRILKRERLKKSVEDFEESQKSDPKAAIDKLQEMDKLRALERASLKHKNTGKWAKHLKIRSKYDDSARLALTEQLQINQQLTQKRDQTLSDDEISNNADNESESEEEDEDNEHQNKSKDNEFTELPTDYNPWLRSGRKSQTKVQTNKEQQQEVEDRPINYETSGPNEEPLEESDNEISVPIEQKKSSKPEKEETTEHQTNVAIDPNDFISIKSHKMKSSFPNTVTELDSDAESIDESDGVSDDEQRKLVSEAFADDDVINDFKKEKLDKIDGEQEKDINLHLPGWGSWGGSGIKPSKRKVRKFTIKANKKQRKDSKLGNVIISEKKDETIAKYRVCLQFL
jgi:U3 small nucleolar RNA-associated protein 14